MEGNSGILALLERAQADFSLDGPELLVLAAIVRHADADGKAWPSLDRIASLARCCRNRTLSAIDRLERLGYIDVTRRRRTGRRKAPNVYTLRFALSPSGERSPHDGSPDAPRQNGDKSNKVMRYKQIGETPFSLGSPHERSREGLEEENIRIREDKSTLFPATSTHNENKPRGRAVKTSSSTSPLYAELLERFQGAASEKGLTVSYPKEGAALKRLLAAYAGREDDLRDLVAFYLAELDEGKEWWAKKRPPLASSLYAVLAHVETAFAAERPRQEKAKTFPCPACGADLPEGAVTCGYCHLFLEDAGRPDAIAEARERIARKGAPHA